jgi:hypothetical protein
VKTQVSIWRDVDQGDAAAAQEQLKVVAQKLDKVAATSTMQEDGRPEEVPPARRVNALKAKAAVPASA